MERGPNTTTARWAPGWMSYIGAVQGVLNAAGMGPWEYWQLMGATGMAYHLVMQERCCISSVTVYDWLGTHLSALDRIGILSEVHESVAGRPTFEAAARRAVDRIRESIDGGRGVILWGVDTGEFGVVYGYDDEAGLLYASGCYGEGGKPIPYDQVGRTFADDPILFYQIIREQVPVDPAQSARSALGYFANLMERTGHVARGYHAGLLAYDNWIKGLQTEGFDQRGCRYATFVYADARGCAARYLQHLAESDPSLAPVAAAFRRTASIYQEMMAALEQRHSDPRALERPVTPAQAAALIPLLGQAKASETEALELVKGYLRA